jgi:hypothetical protein
MKLGIGALFFSYGKTFEEGAEIGFLMRFISYDAIGNYGSNGCDFYPNVSKSQK